MDSDSESSIEEEKIIHCSCGGKFKNNKGSHIQHLKTQRHQKHILKDLTEDCSDAVFMCVHRINSDDDIENEENLQE